MTKRKWLRQSTAFLELKKGVWTKVKFDDIAYVKASNVASTIHFIDKTKMKFCYSLVELQSHLPYGFERVHKSYIVNIKQIDHIDTINQKIFLANEDYIPLGIKLRKNIIMHLLSRNV